MLTYLVIIIMQDLILTHFYVCAHFQSLEVKYLILHSLDEVLDIFTSQEKAEEDDEDEGLQDEEEEDLDFGE